MSYHSDTSLTPMIVAKLIKQLPKLLSIEGYQRTGEAIALLHSIMKQETPTKLQYVHDRKTKFQSLCAIQALCPGKKERKNIGLPNGPSFKMEISTPPTISPWEEKLAPQGP